MPRTPMRAWRHPWPCRSGRLLLLGGHVLPFVLLPFAPTLPIALAALLSLATRVVVTVATREDPRSIPLHPFTVLVSLAIQWSVLLRIGTARRAGWKGRLYPAEAKP